MDIVLFAIPIFFLLIFMEIVYGHSRGKHYYRLNDTVGSLGTGILSQLVKIFTGGFTIASYYFVVEHWSLFVLPEHWLVWIGAFFLYDFCYYCYHRFSHEVNIGWASHVVHHSSEDYNLGTALRQTGTSFYLNWIFYLPMALLGIPFEVFLTVAGLNLVYQFWVHTRHVPKLGFLEWFFITPSNHRVHHAQNAEYIDRNYGGVFIIWDRIFDSFQEELDDVPVIYGIRKPLHSWNPVWANLAYYAQLFNDAKHARRWQDKLSIWFRKTGWRPADVEAVYPLEKTDLEHFEKFDTALEASQVRYAAQSFFWTISASLALMIFYERLPQWLLVAGSLGIAFSLFCLSRYLEHRPSSRYWELARITVLSVVLAAPGYLLLPNVGYLVSGLFVFVVSSLYFYQFQSGLPLRAQALA